MTDQAKLIEHLLADEPAFRSSLDFGSHVVQGEGPGSTLFIGDLSQINLMGDAAGPSLDHRMAHLAAPGDILLVRHRDPEFETYLKDYRQLDNLTVLAANSADDRPVAKQARKRKKLRQIFVDTTQARGGLTIKSYLTTGTIWRLAQTIGAEAECKVHVSGPAPRISKRVNDKLWFARVARDVIGANAVPPTMSAYGPAAAAAIVLHLYRSGQQVIVKVPDSAGSAGNIRLDHAMLARQTPESLQSFLLDQLHATGWSDTYPVLVGVWDTGVLCSPSVQLWIPAPDAGPPQVEGVFEQTVFGAGAAFVGASRSTLSPSLQESLADQAVRIAEVFQGLGYYGKCSFDAVICKDGNGPDTIHWIECNGRWSGVSIPLQVLRNIRPNDNLGGMVVVQKMLQERASVTAAVIETLGPLLYRQKAGKVPTQGVILLSPPAGNNGSVANLLVFAPTQAAAEKLSQDALARLSATTAPGPSFA